MMRKLPLLMMKSSVKIHQFNNDGTNEDIRSDVIVGLDWASWSFLGLVRLEGRGMLGLTGAASHGQDYHSWRKK